MSRTKIKTKATEAREAGNGATPDVLTLAEAAAYLRVREDDVLQMAREQELPGRQVGAEWRFLKAALQKWLGQPLLQNRSKGIWAAAGSWRHDPYLDELLKEINRSRGRPTTEEG